MRPPHAPHSRRPAAGPARGAHPEVGDAHGVAQRSQRSALGAPTSAWQHNQRDREEHPDPERRMRSGGRMPTAAPAARPTPTVRPQHKRPGAATAGWLARWRAARSRRHTDQASDDGRPAAGHLSQVISLGERRAEKLHMQRLRVRHRLAIVAVLLAVLGGLVWLLFFSPFLVFSAARAEIQGAGGNSIVPVADVRRALEAHDGEHLVLVRPATLAADVEKIPEVAHADVHFGFPRSVQVQIVPQQPMACLVNDSSVCTAVAPDGAKLRMGQAAVKTLPKLTIEDSQVKLTNVAPRLHSVLNSMAPSTRKRIVAISVGSGAQLSFTLDSQATVRWGTATLNEQKNLVLSVLLKEKHQVYDVSVPTLPITQ
ncbi:MAG: FtsQ-type POTRA domain-containing protein [Arcanobacterium sp.]|nr:FtsQ-type POTRA domain-containing protein [Arcanobacterium sp.]